MTAIKDGKSIDHIGFWSNERIDYGNRSGDVDQSVIFYLVNTLGYSLDCQYHVAKAKRHAGPYWFTAI
jgi:acetate kinase